MKALALGSVVCDEREVVKILDEALGWVEDVDGNLEDLQEWQAGGNSAVLETNKRQGNKRRMVEVGEPLLHDAESERRHQTTTAYPYWARSNSQSAQQMK